MFRVLNCIAVEHDWRLLVVATIVCFLASFSAVSLFHRSRAARGRVRAAWILTAGAATGSGIWATHFIAMLAYDPGGVPISYDIGMVALALGAAMAVTSGGLFFANAFSTRWAAPVAGAIVGAGLACMHYTGMLAVEVPGRVTWWPHLVAVSIAAVLLFSMAALMIAVRRDDMRGIGAATICLTLAIFSVHFISMGAVEIVPDPTRLVGAYSLSSHALAIVVAGVAVSIPGMALVGALGDQLSNRRLLEGNLRLDAALNNMCQGLCMFDAGGRLIVVNERYIEIYGLSREIVRPGCTLRQLLQHRKEVGTFFGDPDGHAARHIAEVQQGKTFRTVTELGDGRAISIVSQPMAGGGWVAIHEDITDRRRAEARIAHLARHDALTNLSNRATFHEQLEKAFAKLKPGEEFAVLWLDLDHFKDVNDMFGHPVGDALLKSVADRLRRCIRETDLVARVGGDEFAIVQTPLGSAEDCSTLVARVLEAISEPYEIVGKHVTISTSVGIAVAPADGADPDQLLKNADIALYFAKDSERGTYRFFEPEMDAHLQARRALELDLRAAIVNGEFELHYQPIVQLTSGEITGFEALIRWNHRALGQIPAMQFIQLAEETGLILPIGEWVIRNACEKAARWSRLLKVAINLSPVQFKSRDLVQVVVGALTTSGLAPNRLELEITETALLQNDTATLATLEQLRDLGVKISLDDFGTGYSSLVYLRSFPFDKIKIDRSFVRDMPHRADCRAIVRAVAGLACSLDIITVAEGVETKEQLDLAIAEGCHEAQGYLFSRPVPEMDLAPLLAKHAWMSFAA